MESLTSSIAFIGQGVFFTLKLLIGGLFLGITLGLFFAILRYQRFGAFLVNRVISIIRGTPLILQLSLVYFTTPTLLGIKLEVLAAGILTFGINSAAYVAEILRSGIESLPKGQFEAAKVLEIPAFYLWKDIILPQVLRNIFPAMINEVIALLKETALIATIGGLDIMRSSQLLAAEKFTYFMPLCIAGAYYYGLVLLIEYVGKKIEKRESYAKA